MLQVLVIKQKRWSSRGSVLRAGQWVKLHPLCKCFVRKNCKCLSAIQIQTQTFVNSTNICVWLITNIFMLFLSKFSSCICWEIITLCSYYRYLSVILENISHNFKIVSVFLLNIVIICYFHRKISKWLF